MKKDSENTQETKAINYEPLLTAVVHNGVLSDPEYKKYCEYYKFENIETDRTIMGFCIWKSFGMAL